MTNIISAEFHCHSNYSPDSLVTLEDIIKTCRAKGIGKIAITDHGRMAGAFKAHNMAPELVVVSEEVPDTISPYQETDLALRMSVEALPEELKEIILLRYYGDLTVKDTAELLSIPQGTVATRTKKALSLLKEDLTKEEGGSLYENC